MASSNFSQGRNTRRLTGETAAASGNVGGRSRRNAPGHTSMASPRSPSPSSSSANSQRAAVVGSSGHHLTRSARRETHHVSSRSSPASPPPPSAPSLGRRPRSVSSSSVPYLLPAPTSSASVALHPSNMKLVRRRHGDSAHRHESRSQGGSPIALAQSSVSSPVSPYAPDVVITHGGDRESHPSGDNDVKTSAGYGTTTSLSQWVYADARIAAMNANAGIGGNPPPPPPRLNGWEEAKDVSVSSPNTNINTTSIDKRTLPGKEEKQQQLPDSFEDRNALYDTLLDNQVVPFPRPFKTLSTVAFEMVFSKFTASRSPSLSFHTPTPGEFESTRHRPRDEMKHILDVYEEHPYLSLFMKPGKASSRWGPARWMMYGVLGVLQRFHSSAPLLFLVLYLELQPFLLQCAKCRASCALAVAYAPIRTYVRDVETFRNYCNYLHNHVNHNFNMDSANAALPRKPSVHNDEHCCMYESWYHDALSGIHRTTEAPGMKSSMLTTFVTRMGMHKMPEQCMAPLFDALYYEVQHYPDYPSATLLSLTHAAQQQQQEQEHPSIASRTLAADIVCCEVSSRLSNIKIDTIFGKSSIGTTVTTASGPDIPADDLMALQIQIIERRRYHRLHMYLLGELLPLESDLRGKWLHTYGPAHGQSSIVRWLKDQFIDNSWLSACSLTDVVAQLARFEYEQGVLHDVWLNSDTLSMSLHQVESSVSNPGSDLVPFDRRLAIVHAAEVQPEIPVVLARA